VESREERLTFSSQWLTVRIGLSQVMLLLLWVGTVTGNQT